MKNAVFLAAAIAALTCYFPAKAQKKIIDNETYKSWATLSRFGVSYNGKYAWYSYNTASDGDTLVFVSLEDGFRISIPKVPEAVFTLNSKHLVFKSGSGICILDIAAKKISRITNAYNPIVPKSGNGEWLVYQKQDGIVLRNLVGGVEQLLSGGVAAVFDKTGKSLVVNAKNKVYIIDLVSGIQKTVFSGQNIKKVCLGDDGKLAFIDDNELAKKSAIYYYDQKKDSVFCVIQGLLNINGMTYTIGDEEIEFNRRGNLLFFYLRQQSKSRESDSELITKKVNIWHYKDKYLQSHQRGEMLYFSLRSLAASVDISNKDVIKIEDKDTILFAKNTNADHVVVYGIPNTFESGVNNILVPDYQIMSLQTGKRKSFITSPVQVSDVRLSPLGKFITWVDTVKQDVFCYEIVSGKTRCITENADMLKENMTPHRRTRETVQFGGWMARDEAVIIYDRYDIWKIDPFGKHAVNLTSGYGKQNKIVLRLAESAKGMQRLSSKDRVLVAGLVDTTCYNGIFSLMMSGKQKLTTILSPQPHLYYFPSVFVPDPMLPIKALNANVFIFSTQSSNYAPNLVVLRKNNTLDTLSNIHPERDYNWLTSELHHWRLHNGEVRSGILFKPENFDPQKKYPVIFHYYQMNSRGCYMFRDPGLSSGALNIPWYVSNGYLVFVPDIWEQTGYSGYSALQSVESAARYLTHTYDWVDATKMGLQGHSYGGFETNYIVANSNLFAAAQSSAGLSDLINMYGDVGFGGQSLAGMCELWHVNIGGPIWEKGDVYIKNSPIYSVNNIQTPLLLMHNKDDDAVPFLQSLELFISLRRLKRRVWLLQYDKEEHTLGALDCMEDFTLRQQQFFDHYLKGKPAPVWMVEGISAADKGIKCGFEPDSHSRKP